MLIGLTGRAGSGKDSVADILRERHGYCRLAFADPLKDGLIAMGLATRPQLLDRDAKETPLDGIGVSPRRLLQTLGTEWGRRMVADDLWILLAERRLKQYWKFSNAVVITDVRFTNEAEWVRARGGEVWHISRRDTGKVVPLHASEAGVAMHVQTDSVLDNNAGLAQLVDEVAEALAGRRRVENAA